VDNNKVRVNIDIPEQRDCERCIERFRDSLSQVKGVATVQFDPKAQNLTVSFDSNEISSAEIEDIAQSIGAEIGQQFTHETIDVSDLDCADCALSLERAVARLPGVAHVSVNFPGARMAVEYEPARTSHNDILSSIRALGYSVDDGVESGQIISRFRLTGLDCADCATTLERNIASLPGVTEARVNFSLAQLLVRHTADLTAERIIRAIEISGYGAALEAESSAQASQSFWRVDKWVLLTASSGVSLLAGVVASMFVGLGSVAVPMFALAMVLGGYRIARSGLFSLLTSRRMDMNLLMTLAAIGAASIGEWVEGAVVVFLFSMGNTLEAYTMDRARRAIRELMSISPNNATVKRDGREMVVPVETVNLGDTVVVKPGDRIPMDGRITYGASTVNQASITGESMPVEKSTGDEVFAGTINEKGYLEIEVSKPYEENTISKIIHLVEEAQTEKAPSQRFVDRFASYYTPAVIFLSASVALLPWLLLGQPFQPWFYRALVLLVIACPCALVISTPVSIVSAIARAAREGVLVKGGAYLEEAGRIKTVAFDKTGTLTLGKPHVDEVLPLDSLGEEELLNLAAAIEARSEHPLAAAIVRRSRQSDLDIPVAHDFEPLTGRGVKARLDGGTYYVGSPALFQNLGLGLSEVAPTLQRWHSEGKTALIVGTQDKVLGAIALDDQIRASAAEVLRELRHIGVSRIVMLTGDNEMAANSIAAQLGIDEVRAQLLPDQKVTAIRELIDKHGHVAMVGDGINDAPALASASVGIAMGVAGTDVALETADIALMADDLHKVPYAVELSRKALGTIRRNIALSLAIKSAFLLLTFPGFVTLWLAIVADMGASLLVTLNGMRLLGYRPQTHTHCFDCRVQFGQRGNAEKAPIRFGQDRDKGGIV